MALLFQAQKLIEAEATISLLEDEAEKTNAAMTTILW